ncbi:hypothetical protein AMES_1377 [Amycolatopsis mediterranei S699]|uniref:Uncharacterized protein n=2 Tax=Amycolatopsis mediterranei TaxID=33910 RepID=A0A0H3CZ30_AMYMU|nr:hypothetical protein [Amycolatopsis mediterranei]ADJ43199.1 hypothetical protein AMED_1385 [Amycolatopsis mediterranei U32]AEK39897.1 hypothetical protein RAM_07025 [Amycolatopsis mediterranei S699]AFO74913.1 hypothetical protein AMES_1377 [Amycolatopsis mediterranei S699]AGT82042.1 hypothetical protein B737_1378 [Amycolatopsis mediterranei RB]KDO05111.1 hypothetical protein DV26_40925 [Amycolatopsis mediterranei]
MNNDNVSTRPSSPVLLWLVLVVSSAVNAAGPLVGFGMPVRIVAGVIAIGAIAMLVVHYVRRRR